MVPQTEAEKLAAARSLIEAAEKAADPNSGQAWLLTDGVMGVGAKPAWFKGDKYKTVTAQAEAYTALETRFGGFVGAPKNDKGEVAYAFTPPEGVTVKMDHPIMTEFTKWAGTKQLSQEGYNELLGMLVQYEQAQVPTLETLKGRLGENADARIGAVSGWAKANLDAEGFAAVRGAASGQNADVVFRALEAVIAKTATVRVPRVSDDVQGAQPSAGADAIKALQAQKGPDGQRLYGKDKAHTDRVNKAWLDFHAQA